MRKLLTALGVVACAALTAGAADDEKYKSKEGTFAIQFPAGAKVANETKKSGGVEMHMAVVKDGDKAFVAIYADLPAAAKDVEPDIILKGAEKGAVAQAGGEVKSTDEIKYGKDKLPGREFVTDKDGNMVKTRVLLSGTRLYVIVVGGQKDFATGDEAKKFLDSFEVTK